VAGLRGAPALVAGASTLAHPRRWRPRSPSP
jgi:hypothetical protein